MSSISPTTDEFLYSIKDEEKEFFKLSAKIDDDEELREHVCKVQAEAYSIFPYPCIRVFYFLNFQFCHYPAYKQVLRLGKERPGAVYLEIGCALGTDLRKLIADGYSRENVIASDLQGSSGRLGNKPFKTTPETYPLAFIPGDILDPSVFDPKRPELAQSLPSLRSLKSLTPLHNQVSVIHISSVFHLFPPEKQQRLAHILASMLLSLPGSMVLGKQMATDSGIYKWNFGSIENDVEYAWSYSTSAWKELWTGDNGPLRVGEVDTHVIVEDLPTEIGNASVGRIIPTLQFLIWDITRV